MRKNELLKLIQEIADHGIVEAIGDGLSIQDTEFRILYQNEVHKNFIGEHTGKYCYEAYEQIDQICEGCPLFETFRDGCIHTSVRYVIHNQRDLYFEITASPLRNSNGEIIGGIEIVRDITERKLLIDELKLTQFSVNNATDAIFWMKPDARFTYVNNAACLSLGYSREELLTMSVHDVDVEFTKEIWPLHWEDLKRKGSFVIESNHRAKDGRTFPVEIAVNYIKFKEEEFNCAFARDITKRKKEELARKQLNVDLAGKNKELEEILYITSHDLRTPLVNIEGYCNEMNYSINELTSLFQNKDISSHIKNKFIPIIEEDIPESMKYILSGTKKMNSLLRGLKELSLLKVTELNKEHLDMNKLISDVVSIFNYRLQETNTILKISKLSSCTGDYAQIRQLFMNLMDNALKYLNQDQQGVIKISSYAYNNQTIYCIEDNGIGIAADYHDKVLETFYRHEPDKSTGDGLGLTIVNRIIEKHNGRIWVDSELNKGASFFVSLPE